MPIDPRKARKKEEKELEKERRKDRLIQTRVDRRLQKLLVEQARARRISVSNLVRNTLEDAFGLGVSEPGSSASPSIDDEPSPSSEPAPALDHIYAWNSVILGREAECSRCGRSLDAGGRAFMGLSEDPTAPRAWLCLQCGEDL